MTRDDIILMARKAELGVVLTADESVDGEGGVWLDEDVNYITQIGRFAAIVAEAERVRMVKDGWRRCAVGQKTTQFCGMLEDAVKAEREECAKVCEEQKFKYEKRASEPEQFQDINPEVARIAGMTCDFNAAAIRARGDHANPKTDIEETWARAIK